MKLNKKLMLAFLAIVTVITCMFAALPTAHAEEVDETPNFDEDFEAYTRDGGVEQLGVKWTNAWFEKTGDYDEVGCSNNKFSLVADPTNPDNTVLYIDTKTLNESFFFLTIKGLYVKNFELTYDYYVDTDIVEADSPWFGITCRKPIDGRYNGVTNVQMLTRNWGPEGIAADFYRSVNDSHSPIKATGENGEGAAPGYRADGVNLTTINGVWLRVKMVVVDSTFKIYINDSFVGMITVNKPSALKYGLVSFVSCTHKTYIDNIHLENLDEEPYVPEGSVETPTVQAPTMDNTEFTYVAGEDLTIPVSLYGEAVTELKQAATVLLTKYYTVEGDQVTISNEFLSNLSVGRKAFLLSTNGGNVMFYVTVPAAEQETPKDETPDAELPDASDNVDDSDASVSDQLLGLLGCAGSVTASIGALAILSLGVVLLKRKED